MYSRFFSRSCKMCALVAATVALPLLAYGKKKDPPPPVPEVNAGWVLAPIAGAILIFSSWRQFSRAKESR
jgi:hypothetical protein